MIENLGYEDINVNKIAPKVETEIIFVDRWPGQIIATLHNISKTPQIGNTFMCQYIIANYTCYHTFATYAFKMLIYVVSLDNWHSRPDNEKYYGWYIQRQQIGYRDHIKKIWVERNSDRGYIPEYVLI